MKLQKLYKSPSTGQPCTSAQLVAEIITTRLIKKQIQIGDPAYKYWNKLHKQKYQTCIICVCKLMKEFGEKPVVAYFLKDSYGKKVYSAGYYHPHQWIKDSISKFIKSQKAFEIKQEDIPEVEQAPEDFFIPKPKKKKTLIERLKDGEGKEG
jgi:hypothetical protein